MKRYLNIFLSMVIISLLFTFPAFAATASASLTGPSTIRAGDNITLTFSLNGSGIFGASGTITYDVKQLTLVNVKQLATSPWVVEFNDSNMVAYDNNLTNPINKNTSLFSLTFKVNNIAAGTKVSVSISNTKTTDGSADTNIGTVSYSATVAAPLSTNNLLASLKVNNATITPAFSPETLNYTAEVPFEVSKLNVTATAADSKAKVSINSPTLTPNATTNVTITVTAENGSKRTYTIKVKRAQDPNYVPSSNNDLSSITIEGFVLSPAFKSDITRYIVWLPYETESVKVGAKAADSRANIEISGGENLVAGKDNIITITCIAENGERKEYTVIAKRAAPHEELEQSEQTKPSETLNTETTEPVNDTPVSNGTPIWVAVLLLVVGLVLGFATGFLVQSKLTRSRA
jgi:hypothetical protein